MNLISIKDKYPESDKHYLVYNNGYYTIAFFTDGEWLDTFDDKFYKLNEFTHWIPLPKLMETK